MRVAVHVFDGANGFNVAVTLAVLAEVGRQHPDRQWTVDVWTTDRSRVRTSEGLAVDSVVGPEAVLSADLVVLPAWHEDVREPDARLVRSVREAWERGATVAGLCLGAFPVAASGVVDGRRVTTHWGWAAELAARYPAVDVRAEAIYWDHGDVLTSSGVGSTIDAMLHIVRGRLGVAAAASVARRLVIAPHREGDQAQYVEHPIVEAGAGAIGETAAWAMDRLDEDLSVERLAEHARMSRRTFDRRFRGTYGISPARWVTGQRLDAARRLLETTDWQIARVAEATGFGSEVTFRQRFVARYSTTPTSYRARFSVMEKAE